MNKLREIFRTFIRRLYRGRLMSVRSAVFWHQFGRITLRIDSPLIPTADEMTFSTCQITCPNIRTALGSTKLTPWSLDADSVNWLTKYIFDIGCTQVLEFGSGTSSLVFANLCSDNLSRLGGQDVRDLLVVSLEQDSSYAEQSRELVTKNGFADNIFIIHCPLVEHEHELGRITGYNITEDTFKELPAGWRANVMFVDGPATDGWGRLTAIMDSADYLSPECILIMDDALRDDELKIISYLNKSSDWDFIGVAVVSKGIAVARRKS